MSLELHSFRRARRTRSRLYPLLLGAGALLLVACSEESASPPEEPAQPRAVFAASGEQISRGKRLFEANCAVCHGQQAQGAPNWRQRDPAGRFPPPPLNGTGHTWHHPRAQLKQTIRDGTTAIGGSMPAWGDKLTEQQIDDVLAYLQSLWPAEVYQAWAEIDQRARSRR